MNSYTQIWSKYLPVIRILLKRASTGQQSFDLNKTDFERAGVARKSGYKFNIHFSKGRITNVISESQLAKDLATTLLGDPMIKELFTKYEFDITMTPKFQLLIKSSQEGSENVKQENMVNNPEAES